MSLAAYAIETNKMCEVLCYNRLILKEWNKVNFWMKVNLPSFDVAFPLSVDRVSTAVDLNLLFIGLTCLILPFLKKLTSMVPKLISAFKFSWVKKQRLLEFLLLYAESMSWPFFRKAPVFPRRWTCVEQFWTFVLLALPCALVSSVLGWHRTLLSLCPSHL